MAHLVGVLQAICGLEAVASDAGNGELVGMDAAVRIEACRDRSGDTAGGLGEDALSLSKLLNGGDDLDVGNVLGPSS